MTRRQVVTTLFSLAITGGVLYLLLTDQVVADLRALLPQVDLRYIAAALGVGPIIQYLRAWRFTRLLWPRDAAAGRPTMAMYRVSTFLLLFNYLLPSAPASCRFRSWSSSASVSTSPPASAYWWCRACSTCW